MKEDVVLSPAAIVLNLQEEKEEEEVGKEKEAKRTSELAEQLQEKDKIIQMRERKILELSEKLNVKMKELQEQLVEMKWKEKLIDMGIEMEKER
ncbi:uncharacterized protein MONOS_6628 [Monocercomonoides exilis]|uniref:uncharacterized protein n=1 Tax=Monocercomonoides exilis TaxID=2049356 RepID=UPI003559E3F2|nr:hypothetical protein MONOS_6628 [Monocercomonoides exilis]|eukprot:MONOS_6628.1-p1 / transcript=MONOS_6628.1 / gene=MONOS_6628 / organism=Monocercomonoides_exilis_PA203 / gene_product=unspecified product / transcript_product=unspecified product / location=Mono_scaffold00212:21089-21370(-) / protein_length=94 / sequence_SO=supercontig / SO=protein_coding / is_pseudo=false